MATQRGIQLISVFEETDTVGFFYSHNHGGGRPEYIALNVPRGKVNAVASTINFLASRTVSHGETIQCQGLDLVTSQVEGRRKLELLQSHATANTDKSAPLFELLPRFDWRGNPEAWGSRDPAPDGREDVVKTILDVWKQQGSFVLFVDGNATNCGITNLKYVDLAVALRHVDDWKVDWDMDLTPEQRAYVCANTAFFRYLAKVYFRKTMKCNMCGVIDEGKLSKCSRCKDAWYCCREHQKEHWKEHKPLCNKVKDSRNNKAPVIS